MATLKGLPKTTPDKGWLRVATMVEGSSRQLWEEMIQTYVRDGQQHASTGNQRAAAEKFAIALEVLVRAYQ